MKRFNRMARSVLVLTALMSLLLCGCGGKKSGEVEPAPDSQIYTAQIVVENYGTIEVELDGETDDDMSVRFIQMPDTQTQEEGVTNLGTE